MKKRCIAMLMAITIVLTCFSGNGISVNAEEMGEDIDFSYLFYPNFYWI